MSSETTNVVTSIDQRAGRITLDRPAALNALTVAMCSAIETALDSWRNDPDIAIVLIDATGDRAFCAGGDIADMYTSGMRGDLDYGRQFWRDEYRLNYKIREYPKPIVTFLQGFTMGGGVGVGCHASHRIVCENSQLALPEVNIGLVPDVGSTLLLASAPGNIGTYLGLTGARMDAGDALYAGFADCFVPQAEWPRLIETLAASGDPAVIPHHDDPSSQLQTWRPALDAAFAHATLSEIGLDLQGTTVAPLGKARTMMARNSPLAMACAIAIIEAVRQNPTMVNALSREFAFTHRAVAESDFIEGIRAAIIDKDRHPRWKHASWDHVTSAEVAHMTASLGDASLQLKDTT